MVILADNRKIISISYSQYRNQKKKDLHVHVFMQEIQYEILQMSFIKNTLLIKEQVKKAD